MRKRSIILFALIYLYLAYRCTPDSQIDRNIPNGIQLETEEVSLKVQFYTDNIVRVVKWGPGGSSEKLSLAVTKNRIHEVPIQISEKPGYISISGDRIKLSISKKDGSIKYSGLNNETILTEIEKPVFTQFKNEYEESFSLRQKFRLTPEEAFYGLGQHQYGYMNYRGCTVKMVQTNTDAINPFLISSKGYGILWDNYSKTIFDDSNNETSIWSEVGDNIDYYFIYGQDMDEVIAGYRDLTGQAPMYGKWAYGYWQSKEHYEDRNELLSVAKEYRLRKIPIDNIIQDWDYWEGRENWSQMFFDKRKFPRPEEMISRIHDMNYHIMISIWPGLGPNTLIYKDMEQRGYLYNTVGWAGFKYFDAFIPEANDLYWDYVKKGLISAGIDALWIDSTEPDIVNATTKEAEEYEMKKVGTNNLGSWARYLNAYSLVMMDKLYNNQRKETDQRRVYLLTRSAFAGQQRTAATTWSGDIGASWEIYKKQIAAGLNFSMSGIPYWTFDIGAFVLGAYGGVFIKGGKDPAYQELYARMFQFGAFCPVFRSHGSETPREIWEFGDFSESMVGINHLRYRLMPYIYSLAWKVTNDGYTIMRGLAMDFNSDVKTYNINDQYMFGPAIMVCPVTEYMIHRPPENSILITADHFRTRDGKPGLHASYYKDPEYKIMTHEEIVPNIDYIWYTGRPDYVTDSAYAIRWEGKLIPDQTGKHQFHIKCYDSKRIILDGRQLPIIYSSVEQYTDYIELEAGREYDFVMETENRSTGAAKVRLYWKTPDIFTREAMTEEKQKTRPVYLPGGHSWIDFWTGKTIEGGQTIDADAPVDKLPLMVKAGSIVPMGPFVQYSTEKAADPLELRVYPGANATFILYEDENDNYNYEKGVYATIDFQWDDLNRQLTVHGRKGKFPGMLDTRQFNLVIVKENHGTGIEVTEKPDKTVKYNGGQQVIKF
jgi:alpha-D-xyloside xylohydrolase